ncbi:hypothetical protein [Geothrix oryzae]|uniref:hypothetical protein n=1 Tax=Geothrix oryzae TaxID=2927975 RepID=UPI0025729456|nr:hypothetical protein [Geothrix oryzae]
MTFPASNPARTTNRDGSSFSSPIPLDEITALAVREGADILHKFLAVGLKCHLVVDLHIFPNFVIDQTKKIGLS